LGGDEITGRVLLHQRMECLKNLGEDQKKGERLGKGRKRGTERGNGHTFVLKAEKAVARNHPFSASTLRANKKGARSRKPGNHSPKDYGVQILPINNKIDGMTRTGKKLGRQNCQRGLSQLIRVNTAGGCKRSCVPSLRQRCKRTSVDKKTENRFPVIAHR